MKVNELFEEKQVPKICAVLGGRFQPFHRGHYGAYKWLCKKFGAANVWIATSNKTDFDAESDDVSPFSFKEKVEIITTLYDIKPRRIIESKNPAFRPSEVFSLYKGYPIVYVAACGGKDRDRYSDNTFFQPFSSDAATSELKSLKEDTGYFIIVPTKIDGISGTLAREALADAEGAERKKLFKRYFDAYDEVIADLVSARLKELK
jgi:hypothetical protein